MVNVNNAMQSLINADDICKQLCHMKQAQTELLDKQSWQFCEHENFTILKIKNFEQSNMKNLECGILHSLEGEC